MTAAKEPQPLDFTFTAPISKDGAFATYLVVEESAELLGTRRAIKVSGTLEATIPFQATLMPSGTGVHWLPLRAALCKAMGKSSSGELVTVHLSQRLS